MILKTGWKRSFHLRLKVPWTVDISYINPPRLYIQYTIRCLLFLLFFLYFIVFLLSYLHQSYFLYNFHILLSFFVFIIYVILLYYCTFFICRSIFDSASRVLKTLMGGRICLLLEIELWWDTCASVNITHRGKPKEPNLFHLLVTLFRKIQGPIPISLWVMLFRNIKGPTVNHIPVLGTLFRKIQGPTQLLCRCLFVSEQLLQSLTCETTVLNKCFFLYILYILHIFCML